MLRGNQPEIDGDFHFDNDHDRPWFHDDPLFPEFTNLHEQIRGRIRDAQEQSLRDMVQSLREPRTSVELTGSCPVCRVQGKFRRDAATDTAVAALQVRYSH